MDKYNDDDERAAMKARAQRWQSAFERAETSPPAHVLVTFPHGATAAQYERIVDAWTVALAPMSDGGKARAVDALVDCARVAGWTRVQLCAWIDEQIAKSLAARAAVVAEIDARMKRRAGEP